jgi:hypothetical protein
LKCGLSDISSSVNEDHLNVDPSVYIPDIPGEIKTYNTEKTGLFYSNNIIIIIIIKNDKKSKSGKQIIR